MQLTVMHSQYFYDTAGLEDLRNPATKIVGRLEDYRGCYTLQFKHLLTLRRINVARQVVKA
jgi:hypothetical protein